MVISIRLSDGTVPKIGTIDDIIDCLITERELSKNLRSIEGIMQYLHDNKELKPHLLRWFSEEQGQHHQDDPMASIKVLIAYSIISFDTHSASTRVNVNNIIGIIDANPHLLSHGIKDTRALSAATNDLPSSIDSGKMKNAITAAMLKTLFYMFINVQTDFTGYTLKKDAGLTHPYEYIPQIHDDISLAKAISLMQRNLSFFHLAYTRILKYAHRKINTDYVAMPSCRKDRLLSCLAHILCMQPPSSDDVSSSSSSSETNSIPMHIHSLWRVAEAIAQADYSVTPCADIETQLAALETTCQALPPTTASSTSIDTSNHSSSSSSADRLLVESKPVPTLDTNHTETILSFMRDKSKIDDRDFGRILTQILYPLLALTRMQMQALDTLGTTVPSYQGPLDHLVTAIAAIEDKAALSARLKSIDAVRVQFTKPDFGIDERILHILHTLLYTLQRQLQEISHAYPLETTTISFTFFDSTFNLSTHYGKADKINAAKALCLASVALLFDDPQSERFIGEKHIGPLEDGTLKDTYQAYQRLRRAITVDSVPSRLASSATSDRLSTSNSSSSLRHF